MIIIFGNYNKGVTMVKSIIGRAIIISVLAFFLGGCMVVFQKGRRSDIEKIQSLQSELSELKNTKELLEKKLSQEIKDKKVKLKMEDKGLVITFVAEVLFDSGKAKLRKDSLPILDKVVSVLEKDVPNNNINIEGHTDNQPIKYSRWKSNWELSAHRALSVLHYLESKGVNPKKLSATGYGEYRPVAPNDTPEHRQLNRRVEIVIIPRYAKKVKSKIPAVPNSDGKVYKEELK